ncbi:AAA-domain-containing protein [Neoconidiobolus thromboides FSU 785]|nr:AAA-domain-containing protein [Neoconidiobolus thromboides FSU 785]
MTTTSKLNMISLVTSANLLLANVVPPGLEKAYSELSQLIKLPFQYNFHFKKLNIECPKGVLLFGPPGVGKTFLIRQLCQEFDANLISISGPEIYSPYPGESELKLRRKFDELKQGMSKTKDEDKEMKPNILFIDEIDALTPKRSADSSSIENRVVAQLLTLMDGLKQKEETKINERIIIIAATNRPNHIDSALRRPGRFDREVHIDVPNEDTRLRILEYYIDKMELSKDILNRMDLKNLAIQTNGYVGADLMMFIRELVQKQIFTKENIEIEKEILTILTQLQPSLKREQHFINIKEKIEWNSLAGMEDIKLKLKSYIEWPLLFKESFERFSLKTPKGILLFGPPGCSKTSLVRIIASNSNFSMFTLNGASIYSCYIGESEAIIRNCFDRARQASPSIIFIDEIDALIGKREASNQDSVKDRILTMFLNEMDGVQEAKQVLVIGATNRPDKLDSAIMRAGRFDQKIYIPPPNFNERIEILRLYCKKLPLDDTIDFEILAQQTNYFSGADLKALCHQTALFAISNVNIEDNRVLKDDIKITMKEFKIILKEFKPSLNSTMIQEYLDYIKN